MLPNLKKSCNLFAKFSNKSPGGASGGRRRLRVAATGAVTSPGVASLYRRTRPRGSRSGRSRRTVPNLAPQPLTERHSVARLAGVSRATVGRWCTTGALPAIRYGRNWFVPEPLPARVGRTRIPRRPTTE
ncbi:helix-turn-helix domain-containing protein [Streptomyces goshikiensis]|uniref:helix-turn-helix domain-containing protein n=1 Tax=Streptomyces goshikiensis TaxID=1942 RepID=UPI00367FEE74